MRSFLRLLHLTDTHFAAADDSLKIFASRVHRIATEHEVDGIVHTGDVRDRSATLDVYTACHDLLPSVLHVPGNHDDPKSMAMHLPECSLGFPWVRMIGGIRVIGLDSSSGELGTVQAHRLKAILEEDLPAIALLHHPIVPLGSSWLDPFILRDAPAVRSILSEYSDRVLAVLHGHFHYQRREIVHGVPLLAGGAASYQFLPWGAFKQRAELPPAVEIVTVDTGGAVDVHPVPMNGIDGCPEFDFYAAAVGNEHYSVDRWWGP